jgi:TusA-related sulfurtransferase
MNLLHKGFRRYELNIQGYSGTYLKLCIMNALKKMRYGEVLEVIFDDPEADETMKLAVAYKGYRILSESSGGGIFHLQIKKT